MKPTTLPFLQPDTYIFFLSLDHSGEHSIHDLKLSEMDPITAVGFAASILNFVDFAHKVVTGTIEVFKSGRTSKNAHVSEVINDLKDATNDLTRVPPGRSEQQKALYQLSASCQELGKELTTLLERLSTTPGQSKWTSIRVALRSMRKEGKVAEMESTLDRYRSQTLLRLTQIVRYNPITTTIIR